MLICKKDLGTLGLYNYKSLTNEEMMNAFKEYKENRNKEMRDYIITHSTKMIPKVILKVTYLDGDIEDYCQIGMIGLIKAVDTYDADKGVKWATYAYRCIYNEIVMSSRSAKLEKRTKYQEFSMDMIMQEGITCHDVVGDENVNVENDMINNVVLKDVKKTMETVLSDDEKMVLENRYGLCDKEPITQLELSKVLGIVRSSVSRIESRAIRKLSKVYADKGQLFIMVGLPNSGKTDYINKTMHYNDGTFLVSASKFREQGMDEDEIYQAMITNATELLMIGKNVAFDMCNLHKINRRQLIKRLGTLATRTICIFLYKNFSECVADYQKNYEYVYKHLRLFDMPEINEGFDEIQYIDVSNNKVINKIEAQDLKKMTFEKYNDLLNQCNIGFNVNFHTNESNVDLKLNKHMYDIMKLSIKKTDDEIIWIASALHDCGKPLCSESHGTYGKHSNVSSYLAIEILLKMGFEFEIIVDVVLVIAGHENKDGTRTKRKRLKERINILRMIEGKRVGYECEPKKETFEEVDFGKVYKEENEFDALLRELKESKNPIDII